MTDLDEATKRYLAQHDEQAGYVEPTLTDANGDEPEIPDDPTYGRSAFDPPAEQPEAMVGWRGVR